MVQGRGLLWRDGARRILDTQATGAHRQFDCAAARQMEWCPETLSDPETDADTQQRSDAFHRPNAKRQRPGGIGTASGAGMGTGGFENAPVPGHAYPSHHAAPDRGLKRGLVDMCVDAASLLSRKEVDRLQGNAMRLRGLLSNVSATPEKRSLTQHLQGEISHLDKFLTAGMEDMSTRHNAVRPRLMPVSNRQDSSSRSMFPSSSGV